MSDEELDDFLNSLDGEDLLDARGTQFDEPDRLGRVLAELSGPRASEAKFDLAKFPVGSMFADVYFRRTVSFNGTWFEGAIFDRAYFADNAWFYRARFAGDASFQRTTFTRYAQFDGAQFSQDAHFDSAQFRGNAWFQPLLVGGRLLFDRAECDKRLEVQVAGRRVSCTQTQFRGGIELLVGGADVILERTQFTLPSRVSALPPNFPEATIKVEGVPETALNVNRPRLFSLRQSDVSNLALSDVDLSHCRFAEANHLDKLTVEGSNVFAVSPRGVSKGWTWPPVWWWTRRQTLAEEHQWRAQHYGQSQSRQGRKSPDIRARGWLVDGSAVADDDGWPWLAEPATPSADRLASVYRFFRKSREDNKDEPGAADFYFGEMEMRRLAENTATSERFILSGYWLLSGYGLRGLRALASLAVVILISAVLFHDFGFSHDTYPSVSFWDSVVYMMGTTISLANPDLHVSNWGSLLRILVRLAGPLLLGLALLSVRNRVKR